MNFGTRLFKALKVSSKKFKINTKTSQGARARWLKQGRGGGLCSCLLILVIILCSSARHRSEPVAVTLINSRGERSTEGITPHPAVYSPSFFPGTFLISANIKVEAQRRNLQKINSLKVHFNGKQDRWGHVQTGFCFHEMCFCSRVAERFQSVRQ